MAWLLSVSVSDIGVSLSVAGTLSSVVCDGLGSIVLGGVMGM